MAKVAWADVRPNQVEEELIASVSPDLAAIADETVHDWSVALVAERLLRVRREMTLEFLKQQGLPKAGIWPPPVAGIAAAALASQPKADLNGALAITAAITDRAPAAGQLAALNYQVDAFARLGELIKEPKQAAACYEKALEAARKLPPGSDRSRQIARIAADLASSGELRRAGLLAKEYCEDAADRLQAYSAILRRDRNR